IAVYNGSAWDLREITVGFTLVRASAADVRAAKVASGRLLPASQIQPIEADPAEKRPDLTVLYHMKASAPPAVTTVFQGPLGAPLSPGQEWHWAIVEAKGLPPH